MSARIASSFVAVVVTYNRLELLKRCLSALQSQTVAPARIIVVDNASTDGTDVWLDALAKASAVRVDAIRMPENLGGAGGFSRGLEEACKTPRTWAWLMDDDAEPALDALEALEARAIDPNTIYGSLAISGADTSWTMTLVDDTRRAVNTIADMPEVARVESLPFLGFCIHSDVVTRIGLPESAYFIAADDTEYCLRASRLGIPIVTIAASRIAHPKCDVQAIDILGHRINYLRLPPWKRYYDTRNRLLIAKRHHGIKLLTQTLPGSLVRLIAALRHEPRKFAQAWAFFAGSVDGLLGIQGARHSRWRIR